jgi:hypothetical protein
MKSVNFYMNKIKKLKSLKSKKLKNEKNSYVPGLRF